MTGKQARFVAEYLISGNATAAARSAGYSSRCANRQGFKLLSNPEIRAEIDKRLKAMADEKIATTHEVMETLTRILRRQEQDSAVCANGKVVTIPPPVSHILRAAYLLLKVQGAFREPVEAKSDVADLFVSTMEKIFYAENDESAQATKIS